MRCSRRAVSTSRRPSQQFWLSGDSTYTSLPAWQARMPARQCQWSGVAITTASTDLSSRALRKSRAVRGGRPFSSSPRLALREGKRLPSNVAQPGHAAVGPLGEGRRQGVAAGADSHHGQDDPLVGRRRPDRLGAGKQRHAGGRGQAGLRRVAKNSRRFMEPSPQGVKSRQVFVRQRGGAGQEHRQRLPIVCPCQPHGVKGVATLPARRVV